MSTDGVLAVSVSQRGAMDSSFLDRVRFESVPAATKNSPGSWNIVVAAAVKRIDFTILVHASDKSTPLESLEQTLTIVRDRNGLRRLEPGDCATHGLDWKPGEKSRAGDPGWTSRLHPRLSWDFGTGHEFPELAIDLTFINATEYLNKVLKGGLATQYSTGTDPADPHHGCVLHAMEYSGRQKPKTWFVLVPPSLNTAPVNVLRVSGWRYRTVTNRAPRSVDLLLFLRSAVTKSPGKMRDYSQIEETPIEGWMNRFFAEPPTAEPFFAAPNAGWNHQPPIGFERQLVGSGKSLLLVYPWPSGLTSEVLYSGNLRPLFDRLIVCMASAGAIGLTSAFDIRCGRIGVAGYSGGGNEAIKIWRADRNSVDELYLFDPQSFRQDQGGKGPPLLIDSGGAVVADLREWYREPSRRFRMIGGLQHDDALLIATALEPDWRELLVSSEAKNAPPPRVWVRPMSAAFRSGDGMGEIYARAFLVLADTPGSLSQYRLSAVGSPPSALTQATGIELVAGTNPRQTTVRIIDLKRNETLEVSHAEFAGFLHTLWRPQIKDRWPTKFWQLRQANPDMRVSNNATFLSLRRLLAWYIMYGQDQNEFEQGEKKGVFTHDAHGVRHQWTTPGGENDATRGANFRGYWELCLRASAFRN